MRTTDLSLPLASASTDRPEEAFASAFAAAMRSLHLGAGGEPAAADDVALAAARVAEAIQAGKTWVDLTALASDAPGLIEAVRASPVAADAGSERPDAPLVLAGERLYLARYWDYERTLAASLAQRNRARTGIDEARLQAELDRHFPAGGAPSPNWQKVAAATAVLRGLCVISGGPGTGKTTTVVRILAILLTLDPELKIAIAAPTGKAAARVQESIRLQLDSLKLAPAIAAAMPREPHTIHRLLGFQAGRTGFRYNRERRLPYDVVVVDEASMLDLAMAAKLAGALRDDARLILLGDKDQLSSVEAGAVYAGISSERAFSGACLAQLERLTGQPLAGVPAGAQPAALADAVVWLEHSYRFGLDSALGRLARAINSGDRAGTLQILSSNEPAIAWSSRFPPPRVLVEQLMAEFEPYVATVKAKLPAKEVFAAFDRFRVLCSTREGAYGSARLGALLAEALRRRLGGAHVAREWFIGRPVLVTANDYAMRLFNGDVGIVLPDASGKPTVHFAGADGAMRAVSPSRLGALQEAMAITVHRSQGSEFVRVAVVVEPTVVRGLSRELLYTAVTRAKDGVRLWAQESALDAGSGKS